MFPNVGWFEMMVIMGIAVLLFGKRLPEVGRSLGKGIVEFKKGLRGIEDELDLSATDRHVGRYPDDRPHTTMTETSIPKFEPPTAASSSPVEHTSHPID